MRIVIDTNVVISGVFFGGTPRKVIEAVMNNRMTACANVEIVNEYAEIVEEMVARRQGSIQKDILFPFVSKLELFEPVADVQICRDPDDDKFISCALDSGSLYIVSGDKDLLDLKQVEGISIITAADFCRRFL